MDWLSIAILLLILVVTLVVPVYVTAQTILGIAYDVAWALNERFISFGRQRAATTRQTAATPVWVEQLIWRPRRPRSTVPDVKSFLPLRKKVPYAIRRSVWLADEWRGPW
jgi:hypothetical protein